MAYGEHHLDAYDPEIGRTRTHTPDELQKARGRSLTPGYRFYSVEEAEKMQEQKRMQEQTDNQLLKKLVDLGNKFRLTPIVDDDFPAQRDNFDACLREATEYLMKKRQGNRVWYDFFKLLWLSFQKEPPPGIGGICCGPFIPDIRYGHVIKRPICSRCHGPLDFFPDPDTGRYGWCCNNPEPMMTDEEFKRRWDELPGDDVAKLTREA